VPWRVSTNRPHSAHRGAKIYRNYDIEWQKQVEASIGNRKIDIDLVLAETETGYELMASICRDAINRVSTRIQCDKIIATNPEKATENIRKKALQWGDTPFNPINLELQFAEPRLIPASVIGEMKRALVEKLTDALIVDHQAHRSMRRVGEGDPMENSQLPTANCQLSTANCQLSTANCQLSTDPDAIPDHLMTCHHCIRYANGICSKETGQKATDLYLRNGKHTFRLEFDCRHCLMYVCPYS
jgi:putative protease